MSLIIYRLKAGGFRSILMVVTVFITTNFLASTLALPYRDLDSRSIFVFCLSFLCLAATHPSRVGMVRPVTAVVSGVAIVFFTPASDTLILTCYPCATIQILPIMIPALLVGLVPVEGFKAWQRWLYVVIEPYALLGVVWLASLPWLKTPDLSLPWLVSHLWYVLALPSSLALLIAALLGLLREGSRETLIG